MKNIKVDQIDEGLLFISFEEYSTGRSSSVVIDKEKAKEFRDVLSRYLDLE